LIVLTKELLFALLMTVSGLNVFYKEMLDHERSLSSNRVATLPAFSEAAESGSLPLLHAAGC
jgi:hypothetical protein